MKYLKDLMGRIERFGKARIKSPEQTRESVSTNPLGPSQGSIQDTR